MTRGMWTGAGVLVVAVGLTMALLLGGDPQDPAPPEDGRSDARPAAAQVPSDATADATAGATTDQGPRLEGASEAEAPDASAPGSTGAGGKGTLFTGKVADATGEPAVGAEVEAVATTGVVASAVTNEQGAFAFRLVVTEAMKEHAGMVRARGADGATGLVPLYFVVGAGPGRSLAEVDPNAPREVGAIRLGPPRAFDVRVVSRCAGGLPATLWLVSATFSVLPAWSVIETDDQGAATIDGVPDGTWVLVAAAPGCGRARTFVKLPRESSEAIELELPEAHVVTVKVRDADDASPIAGAAVSVLELLRLPQHYTRGPLVSVPSRYVTDGEGIARITGLGGEESLTVFVQAEGYPRGSEHSRGRGGGPGEARVEEGETEVVIELHKPITVRWPIKDEGIGIPADGTEVSIEPWTNTGRLTVPPKGVIENGEIVVDGWGSDGASGYAVLADKGIARLSAQAGQTVGYPTAFYRLGRVEVIVRLPDGTPAEGWFLTVRDGGNNDVKPKVKTDAEGRAVMAGLYGGPRELVNVSVSDTAGWGGFSMPLGSIDLGEADGYFEARIPEERSLRIRLTVQGRTVPDGFAGRPTLNHRPIPAAASEDADPGLFVHRWRPHKPDAQVYISAQAAGYIAATEKVSLADVSESTEVVVDLRPAGSVEVKVEAPEDGRYRVTLQRRNEDTETWGLSDVPGGFRSSSGQQADANGIVAFRNIEPGRYRAVETTSGLTSDAFDVPAGGDPVRVSFDVSTTGWAKGRVVLPEGVLFAGVTVGEVGGRVEEWRGTMAGAAALPGRPVNRKDGTFWFRLPGNRPVTLRLFHATLKPHPTKGLVTLTKPREGIELHALQGATATVRFSKPAPIRMNPGQPRAISVRLYEGAVEGEGLALSGVLDAQHERVAFGGYEPGTYTVWIDAPGSAPVVVPAVQLGADETDLGVVDLQPGATFEIQVTVKEGQSPPRFSVWVVKLDAPTYTRGTDGSGETIRIQGIGAGRFRVSALAYNGAAPGIQEEIEFDGATKVVRTIDIR